MHGITPRVAAWRDAPIWANGRTPAPMRTTSAWEGAKRHMPRECSVLVECDDPRVVGLAGDDAGAVPKRVAREHDPVSDA